MSDFQSPDWSPTDSEPPKASDYKTHAGGYDFNDLGTVRALLKHIMMERDRHWERIAEFEAEVERLRAERDDARSWHDDHCAMACDAPWRADLDKQEEQSDE
jgi:hypothetical protein